MKMSRFVLMPLASVLLLSGLCLAQEAVQPAQTPAVQSAENRLIIEQEDMETPAMKGAAPEKPFAPRLPRGYRAVVSDSQRDEIHEIQKEYGEIIERLKARIRLLETERNRKIEATLTPEQSEKIKAGREQSRIERLRNAAAKRTNRSTP